MAGSQEAAVLASVAGCKLCEPQQLTVSDEIWVLGLESFELSSLETRSAIVGFKLLQMRLGQGDRQILREGQIL